MFRFSEYITSANINIFGGIYAEEQQLEPEGAEYFFWRCQNREDTTP